MNANKLSLPIIVLGIMATIVIFVLVNSPTSQGQANTQAAALATLPPISPLQTPTPLPPLLPTHTPVVPPPGPTPQPTPWSLPPVPPSVGVLGYHTVRAGETLFCIGRAYGVLPWAIASQNGLSYPDQLRVGQTLSIPNVPWVPAAGPVCTRQFGTTPPSAPQHCSSIHAVYFGATLYSIARQYGTSIWALVLANQIANPDLIFVGQTLCIP